MTREVQERAFDPFFTTKPPGKGTGLGLASVYGIARQMEGEVSIYSELGRGTTVRLHLPVADAEVTPTAVVRTPAPTPHGRTVLLVEDEELLRQALDRTLSEAGFVVTTAESAEKALGRLDDGELPDLLVSDVSLPGMPGPELALLLRERAPDLPVLLMSGYAAHPLARRPGRPGRDDRQAVPHPRAARPDRRPPRRRLCRDVRGVAVLTPSHHLREMITVP